MSGPQNNPHNSRPEYRLAREPDGRSWTARENLVDILERELLGPADGPEEVLNGAPDAAYLVGRIAPVRLTADEDDPRDAESGEAVTDVGDAVDAKESRGVPVTAVDESATSADEDTAEDEPQKRGLMIPASMGLRCQIPSDLESFTVTASWGVYEPIAEKAEEKTRLRRYKRIPIEITKTIVLTELIPAKTATIPLKDDVVLRTTPSTSAV
jgi:hypothetical protein